MTTKTHGLFSARIIEDSVSPAGARLTTAELIFPRMILSEFNTHRVISKNSASSRAIPVKKQLEKILNSPYVPNRIGVNQPGMQASVYLEGEQLSIAQAGVYRKRDRAIIGALEDLVGAGYVERAFGTETLSRILLKGFNESDMVVYRQIMSYYEISIARAKEDDKYVLPQEFLNIHKQTLNRYIEPYMMHTAVITGTDWDNFFALRGHDDAQDEIRIPAELLQRAMEESTPRRLEVGEWHLPFVQEDEREEAKANPEKWRFVSTGRCARTSHETHNGVRDPNADMTLSADRLLPHGHMSPFEHVATPLEDSTEQSGNFRGWKQFRKEIPFEDNYALKLADLEDEKK